MQTESLQGLITWPHPSLFFRRTAKGIPWHHNDLHAKFQDFAQQQEEGKACQQNSCKIHLLQSNIYFLMSFLGMSIPVLLKLHNKVQPQEHSAWQSQSSKWSLTDL